VNPAGKGYSTGAHVMQGRIPPCWGQCWVHRSSKNLDQKCGDKPKKSGRKAVSK
jgi:hypothetical protein